MARNPEVPEPTQAELDQLVSDLHWLLTEANPERSAHDPLTRPTGRGMPEVPNLHDAVLKTLFPSYESNPTSPRQRPLLDRRPQLFALMKRIVPRELIFDVSEPDFNTLRADIDRVLGWAQDPLSRSLRRGRERDAEVQPEAEPTLHLTVDPETLAVEFGDDTIPVVSIEFGTAGWSLMRAISELEPGKQYEVDEVAQSVDTIYGALSAEPTRSDDGQVIDNGDLASAMAIRRRRRPRAILPYEGSESASKRLEALLRSTTGRDQGARWRHRWITWDHDAQTFLLRSEPKTTR